MQQTVWNVQENICVMESVNGTVTERNVNSNKVLFNKNNKTISQFAIHLCFKKCSHFSKFHFSKEHKSVLYEIDFYCLKRKSGYTQIPQISFFMMFYTALLDMCRMLDLFLEQAKSLLILLINKIVNQFVEFVERCWIRNIVHLCFKKSLCIFQKNTKAFCIK